MKSNKHTTLVWTTLIVGTIWSVYSTTAELLAHVNCLKHTLLVCGNTWFIRSMI
ncbi:MAG TPA: hypothetical protein VGX92_19045 [Pyrinomonadaceae bacterium]|jgi:hypothetical protein|nr:hypothetical protein [Pyrinomonadaceae bacterium]